MSIGVSVADKLARALALLYLVGLAIMVLSWLV